MAAVIVPNQGPVHRRELMARMVAGLLQIRPASRVAYLCTMNEALATTSLEARTTVTREMRTIA